MALQRPKPPSQTKAELMPLVVEAIIAKWPNDPAKGVLFLLNFFTAIDLSMIKQELEKE